MTHNPRLRLRSLYVRDFRGIGDSLAVIDLSAPLTVIHAANGTGKTSLCQAMEWVLTGKVGGLSGEDLAFRLRPGAEPMVEVVVQLDDETWTLQRDRKTGRAGRQGAPPKAITDTNLLAMLAPAALDGPKAAQSANLVRTTWLKGSHFLDAANLAVLLDSDKDSKMRREEVFADLLGIRRLLDTEGEIDKYIARVRPRTRDLGDRIDEKERALSAIPDDGAAAETAERELADARGALRSAAAPMLDQPFEERLANAAVTLSNERRRLTDLSAALALVDARWDRHREGEERLPLVQKRLERCAALLARWSARQRALRASIARAAADAEAERAREAQANGLAVDVRDRWAAVAHEVLARWGTSLTCRSLFDLLPEASWTQQRRSDHRSALVELGEQRADQIRRRAAMAALAERIAGVPDAGPDRLADAERELTRCEDAAREAAETFDAAAGPLDQLRAAGRTVLAALGDDERSCPLCGHGWSAAQELRAAVGATLAATPPIVVRLEDAKRRAGDAVAAARQTVQDLRGRLRLLNQLKTELARESELFDRLAERAVQLGCTPDERGWADAIVPAVSRLDLATAMNRLMESLGHAQALLQQDVPQDRPLEQAVEWACAALHDTAAHSRAQARERLLWMARADAVAARVAGRIAGRREDVGAAEVEANALRRDRAEFLAAWRQVSSDGPQRDVFERANQHCEADAARLDSASAHLDAARAAQSASLAWRQRQVVERELADLRARKAGLDHQVRVAQDACRTLQDHRKAYIAEQLAHLMPVVRTLFARMHANRVFDAIRAGEADDPLVWLADAGEEVFDPSRHFSNGQRQDLALALFLARACRLGGTFFLDEPLVHLDDLNRVALLDILRMLALTQENLGLVLTTASRPLVRHLEEKFARLPGKLNVVRLQGNPRIGVAAE